MKKSIKIHFNDWKAVMRTMALSNYFISFNGETQKVTVKNLKNENPRLKIGTTSQKIVFQGPVPEDKIFYNLSDGSRTLENENILIGKII